MVSYNAELMHISTLRIKATRFSHSQGGLGFALNRKLRKRERERENEGNESVKMCVENLLHGKTGESNSLMFSVKRILRLL